MNALKKEIQLKGNKNFFIDSIFIGGGTPSFIDGKYIFEILEEVRENFTVLENIEISIETNPKTFDEKKLEFYKKAGINRLSIGVQSFNDKILKELGRNHNSKEVFESIELVRKFDFDINLGDRVEVYQDGELTVVTPAEVQMDLSLEGDKSVKSHLLQGILDLFLETLNIYNNHLGDLKKISTQLLITLFMAWSLLGVILVEILLFVESVIVFVWRLLVRLVKLMRIKDNTKVLIDEKQKRHDKRERKKDKRRDRFIFIYC